MSIQNSWHKFLQSNFNTFLRNAPNIYKERKYSHIDVQKQFDAVENERKKQRLSLIEYKKKLRLKLVQQQVKFLQENKSINQITDSELLNQMQKESKIDQFKQFNSYEEYIKQIQGKSNNLLDDKTLKQLKNKECPDEIIEVLESEKVKLQKEIDSIMATKQELSNLEDQIEDLEPTHIQISGLQKKLVLNMITYYEFMSRNLVGCIIHPETVKAIETVHYHVEHNLPIRRELLFEVCPELFENEIAELEPEERQKLLDRRPKLETAPGSVLGVYDKNNQKVEKLEFYEELNKQQIDMQEFVYKKAGEFTIKHAEQIANKLTMGFLSTEHVLENIENKEPHLMTENELEMFNDLKSLSQINDDYHDLCENNKIRIFNKQRELWMPKFVEQHEKLRKAYIEKWDQLVTNSFDFQDSIFIPDNSDTFESKLDAALKQQRKLDVEELIKQSQLEYKSEVGDELPIRKNVQLKDDSLVKKLNVLSNIMDSIPEDEKQPKQLKQYTGTIMQDQSEEQRILITEMTKILYLNNKDSAKYNLQYWAEHFNIEPQKLRNIFNYVSYAIPDVTNEKETGRILRFIY